MGRKRKQSELHQWKPVAIEFPEGMTAEDFKDLVAFEELTDYRIEKPDLTTVQEESVENTFRKKNKLTKWDKIKKCNQFKIEKLKQ